MKNNKEPENKTQYMPIFMCLGLSVGMAIGAGVGNIGVGMCLGIGVGVCLGACIDHINKKSDSEPENDEKGE